LAFAERAIDEVEVGARPRPPRGALPSRLSLLLLLLASLLRCWNA